MSELNARVKGTLKRMVGLLNADDYPGLANYYDFPFVMELQDSAVVFVTPADAMIAWANFRKLMLAQGDVRSDFRIVAVELPRMARQRVWVEFQHFDAAGRMSRSSDLVLYFRLRGEKMVLVMQHITRHSLPPVWAIAGQRAAYR